MVQLPWPTGQSESVSLAVVAVVPAAAAWRGRALLAMTALLLAGALFCQSYFDRADPVEAEVRAFAEKREPQWLPPGAPGA